MAKRKKSGNRDTTNKILLVTATLNLIRTIFEIIHDLID